MEALKVRDADSLGEIISADFSYASPRFPALMNRAQYLEHVVKDLKLSTVEFDQTTIRMVGRTAILNSQLKLTGTVKGADWSGNYLVTDVWINQGGTWRVFSRHESPIKEQP
jgi:hypothetical protein